MSAYEKHGDALAAEHPLTDVDVDVLRRLWNRPADDPMFESYPITPEIAEALAVYVGQPLRLSQFDYFLEYADS